jgi:hypothetical protein
VYEHDKANLQKLVGDLQPGTTVGGHMGALMHRIDAAILAPPPPGAPPNYVQQLQQVKADLAEQINLSRAIFTSGAFREGEGDPYKMVRHVMRAMDLERTAS